MGGKCCEKKQAQHFLDSVFFQALKKNRATFTPHIWDSVIFRAEMFGLLSPSLPLMYWSQGFSYSFLTCNGIIICTRPNFFKTLI